MQCHSQKVRQTACVGMKQAIECGHRGRVTDPDAQPDPSAGDFLLTPQWPCPSSPGHRKGSDGHRGARNMQVGMTGLGAPARGPLNVPHPRPGRTGGAVRKCVKIHE